MSNLQNKPLVSVLMCVYNTKVEYLEEASSSILNQTYQDIEFIIVDDGSSEQSTLAQLSNICSRSDKVRLIRNNNNIGLTKSLNIGLKKCSGKYIARMDALLFRRAYLAIVGIVFSINYQNLVSTSQCNVCLHLWQE